MNELLAFQKYASADDANAAAGILEQAGIKYEVAKRNEGIGTVILGDGYDDSYILRIAGADFITAKELLKASARVTADDIDPHHPLRAMTVEELKDIVAKPDEWGMDNYNVAIALLQQKGITVSESELLRMQEERMKTLSVKKSINPLFLVLGYLASCLHIFFIVLKYESRHEYAGIWFFPGFFGTLLGLVIINSKTTLPDGRRIPAYNSRVVKHGMIMLGLGILGFVLNILAYLLVFSFLYS